MLLEFEGREIQNPGELGSMLCEIARAQDRERAARFYACYLADMETRYPVAEAKRIVASNIGYVSGYYSPDTMKAIQDVFDVGHPIFGRRTNVVPEDAFDAGAMMALGIDPQMSGEHKSEDA